MIRATQRLSRVSIAILIASGAGLAAVAAAAASPAFLKIKDLPGESRDKGHKEEIEILSFSWGATQPGSHAGGTGMGAGKANIAPGGEEGKVSKVEAIAIKQGVAGDRPNDRLRNAGPVDGWPSAAPATTIPPTVTLKRGQGAATAGGVSVAAGDVDGDGRAAARSHDKRTTWVERAAPAPQGALRIKVKLPWLACSEGMRLPLLELGDGTRTHRISDAVVTSCSEGGDRPMETISLNYTKIE